MVGILLAGTDVRAVTDTGAEIVILASERDRAPAPPVRAGDSGDTGLAGEGIKLKEERVWEK